MDDREMTRLLKGVVDGLHTYARGEEAGLVTAFATVQADRVERLEAAHRRVSEEMGEQHPAVQALAHRVEGARRAHRQAEELARRAQAAPRVRAHELLVSGEVVDRDGRPLPGLRVRLYDRDVRDDDLLGDEWTDAGGAFHMVFHERDYHEAGEGEPELYLVIDAADGTRLANTRDQAAPESGVVPFMRVQLSKVSADEVSPSGGVSAGQCTAVTTKGTRCKRPARPGTLHCAVHAKEPAGPDRPRPER